MKKRMFMGLSLTALMVLAGCGFGSNNSSVAGDSSLPGSLSSEAGSSFDASSLPGASSVTSAESSAASSANSSTSTVASSSKASSSSSKASSSSSKASSSKAADPAWLASEKKVFQDHFYGADIPFPNIKGLKELIYDEEDNVAYAYGGTSTAEFLASYAALFDASWEEDTTAGVEGASAYYYTKTKKFSTPNGDRYVEVLFCGFIPTSGKFTDDGSGTFYIQISDPYIYDWPQATVDAALEAYGVSDTVPAFKADYYIVNDRYVESDNLLAVFAFTNDAEAQTKYGAQLVAAGYELKGTTSSGIDVYYSVNGEVEVDVRYETDEQVLDIYIAKVEEQQGGEGEENIFTSWPTDIVSSFLANVVETEETVPAYTAGSVYQVNTDLVEEYQLLYMYILSTKEDFDAYEAALETAGFTYQKTDQYGDDIYLSPLGEIELDVGFDEEDNVVDLWIMPGTGNVTPDYEEFPAEELAGYISTLLGSEETIPSFDYATVNFMFDNDEEAPYVNVYTLTDDLSHFDDYDSALEEAGWTYEGYDEEGQLYWYLSPEGTLELAFDVYESGTAGRYYWDCYILATGEVPEQDDSVVYTPATLRTPGYGTSTTYVRDEAGEVVDTITETVHQDAYTCESVVVAFFQNLAGQTINANESTLTDGTPVLYAGGNFGTSYSCSTLVTVGKNVLNQMGGFEVIRNNTTQSDGSVYAIFAYVNPYTDTAIIVQLTGYPTASGNVLQIMTYLESYSELFGA